MNKKTRVDPLVAATAAVAAGELADGLRHALVAWRDVRDPALADAIEALATALPPAPPLPAKGGKAQDSAFALRADAHDPADFAVLAACPLPRTREGIEARLRALARRPADPRLSTYLFALMAAPPSGATVWWKLAMSLIAEAGDPRSIARLEAFATPLASLARESVTAYAERRRREAVAELGEAFPEVPVLDEPRRAPFAAAVAAAVGATQIAAESGDQLLAEIYARPDDDRARMVYGDWLQDRGDPRGELIALQLAGGDPTEPARVRRERALIAAHGKAWLGSIAPVVVLARSRFARGFLSSAVVHARTGAQLDATVGAPEWATAETVRFTSHGEHDACGAIVRHPTARALREAHGLGISSTAAVAGASPPLPLIAIGLNSFGQLPDEVLACPGLPQLARIHVALASWMVGAGVLQELREAPVAAQLSAIALEDSGAVFTLLRGARGRFDVLRVDATADQLAVVRDRCAQFAADVPGLVEVELSEPALAAALGPLAHLPRRDHG